MAKFILNVHLILPVDFGNMYFLEYELLYS